MTNSRRTFLRGISASAAALAYASEAAASPLQLHQALAVTPDRDTFWNLVSRQYPLRTGKTPFNAANLCPSPRSVSERVAELTRDLDSDVAPGNRTKFADYLEDSRRKVASQLNVSPDEIALVRNTSEANTTINNGMPLGPGDEVVLWEQNHPCNNDAWDVRAARHGFQVKRVAVPANTESVAEIVKLFEAALTPKTKVLSITYVSNTSGYRLPAKEICALARQRGIHAHVDGAQVWGYLNLDLKDIGCDSFGASAHKWFMGPKEVGVLYVRKERIPHIWPSVVSAGWTPAALKSEVASRKFEVLGQRDDGAVSSVGTAVDFHRVLGFANVEGHTTELAQALKEGLARINRIEIVTPMNPARSGGVVISRVKGFDQKQMGAFTRDLYEKFGIGGAPVGGLRLCPHTYNTMSDVEAAIQGVRSLLA
ncbi:MAG: aminotransferase class V-fold PLP-dependent enzyme [Bryobacteraceae bacterium]